MQENETEELNDQQVEKVEKKLTIGSVLLSFFDFLKTIIIIVILAALIRQFLIQPFIVDGQSMEPNFHNNDYLITDKISYRLHAPQRGEAIIFHPPNKPSVNYLKRITGVPGDTIEVKNGEVFVNSKKIVEPYIDSGDKTKTPTNDEIKITLKSDEYFVLGDNRNHSSDSREIGPIPKENIVSRVWLRLFPLNSIGALAAQHYQTTN